jgi:hypothetical protein
MEVEYVVFPDVSIIIDSESVVTGGRAGEKN